MSHEDISSAWSVLSGRQDIDHIVRELIGNHYLNASFAQRDSSHLREAILSHVLTLKITFDLQRSYLQSSEPSKESTCSTLQPDSISTAVFHLLDVVLATCTSCPGLAIEESFIRLTAQTTLSSLRVLLLLNKSFAAWEHDLLQSRFEEVYQRGHWHDSSQALILSICRHIIQALASPTQYRKYTVPACGAASLPDFFTGLYVFQGHSRSAVDASLSNPGVSLHSANWFHDCLVLYDLQWSTTAALIQLCAARRRRQETKTGWSEVDQARELSDFRLVLATRFQLQQQILYAVGMRTTAHWTAEQLRTLLCQDLCAACAEDRCQCFQGDWSVIEDLRLQHGMQHLSMQVAGAESLNVTFTADIKKAIQNLQLALEKRSISVTKPRLHFTISRPDSSLSTASCVGQAEAPVFKRAATAPYGEIPRREASAKQYQPPLPHSFSSPDVKRPFVALSDQHQLTASIDRVPETASGSVAVPQRQPSNTSSYGNASFPTTTTISDVFSHRSLPLSSASTTSQPHFRQIDLDNFPEVHHPVVDEQPEHPPAPVRKDVDNFPEVYSPTVLEPPSKPHQPQPWQPDRDNYLEVVTSPSLTVPGSPSIVSEDSGGSRSLYRADTSKTKSKKWQGLFSSGRGASASSTPTSTFFASGNSLLIWNECGAGCYDLNNAHSIQFRRINASSVCAAAGGRRRCAVVVKGISEYRLEIYEGPCDVAIREWKLETLPFAIAMSRNDDLVAVKFDRNVYVFQISDGRSFCHNLPPQNSRSGRGNHLVTFSTDSLSFVATTRYEPEKVITYWSECTNSAKATCAESSAPTGYPGDDGLSALVCSNATTRAAFLTTFTEKGCPTFLSLKSPKLSSRLIRDTKGRIGSRIHRAVLCPNGTNLILMNQRNDVFWVDDCWTGTQEPRRVGSIKRPVSVVREVDLGMPNSDEVHVFWIEKAKGMLVTMGKGGGKTKPLELVVDLDRLIA